MALLLLIAGAGTIYAAANLRGYGVYWAYSVCTNAGDLCNHTNWMATVIIGAAALYIIKEEWAS